jgi:hypothetical protein
LIGRRLAEGSSRSLGFGRQPSICKPVGRWAAALEALFRTDRERAALGWSCSNLALTAESYFRARIVVEHVLAPNLTAPRTLLTARYT